MRENLRCPRCLSDQLIKIGRIKSGRQQKQYWHCKSCGRYTVEPIDLGKVQLQIIGGRIPQ